MVTTMDNLSLSYKVRFFARFFQVIYPWYLGKTMGISTTGFVLTETKDVFAVMSTIENTLIEIVKKYSQSVPIFQDDTSRFPVIEFNPKRKFLNIHFKVNSEVRMLMVHFNCDSDYSEYGGSKIIWSLNYWGLAEEIVLGICQAMKEYGQVFYEANDFDGEVVEVEKSLTISLNQLREKFSLVMNEDNEGK